MHRRLRGAARRLVPAHDGAAAGARRRAAAPIPTSTTVASFIGADGTNADAPTAAASRSRSSRATSATPSAAEIIAPPAAASSPRSTGITLYLQPVQDLQIDNRVSRTQYQYTLEDADPDELRRVGAARCSSKLRTLPAAARRGQRPADRRARSWRSPSIATPRRASASRRRRSTTRSTTPSASASSRPSSPSSTSTA